MTRALPTDRRVRRSLLQAPVVLAVSLSLTACGFKPRGAVQLGFERLALTGFAPRSPVRDALERQLQGLPVQQVPVAQAEVVVELLRESALKTAVVSTAAGQVREWQLVLDLEFRVVRPGGDLLLPAFAVRLSRDLTTSETLALSKAQEEALLWRALQHEAVGLLLRRLSAVQVRGA